MSVLQVPRDKPATLDGSLAPDNTGWAIWPANAILLRALGDDSWTASRLLPARVPDWRVLDLSAGAGLLSCCFKAAGGVVVAVDLPEQVEQCAFNCNAVPGPGSARVVPYAWGAPLSAVVPVGWGDTPPFHLCVACDILYIALRDGVAPLLADTLRQAVTLCGFVLFAFEERLPDEESAFMEELALTVGVQEWGKGECVLSIDEAIEGTGGHASTELWNPRLFWEPPPLRVFTLKARGE